MSDRRAREQQRKKFQELITGNTGNTGNETRSKRLRTSNYRNDNDNSTIVSFGSSSGRGNDNNDNSTIISSGSGRGRGKDNEDNYNNNFGNNFEGIRKYIEVIIFRFIIKNFLFITYIRTITSCGKKNGLYY